MIMDILTPVVATRGNYLNDLAESLAYTREVATSTQSPVTLGTWHIQIDGALPETPLTFTSEQLSSISGLPVHMRAAGKTVGSATSRNIALHHTQAETAMQIDEDDALSPAILQAGLLLLKHPAVGFVNGGAFVPESLGYTSSIAPAETDPYWGELARCAHLNLTEKWVAAAPLAPAGPLPVNGYRAAMRTYGM
jgi:hypothetical protein